ncbi:ATP-grasp domain-containing protein [Aliihoeflea sp. PC F10.4]
MVDETRQPGSRSHRLAGKRVLIVMGSYEGKRPVYEALHALGVRLIVMDGAGHWSQHNGAGTLFERFLLVDLRADQGRLARALDAIRECGLPIDAVATFEEFAGELTSQIADALDMPGHHPSVIAISRDKLRVRQACVDAGIPTPRFAGVKKMADLEAAADHVGFPAILKPTSGASSVSSYRVTSLCDLQLRYAEIESAVSRLSKSRQLNSDDEFDLVWNGGQDMVLEECLTGEEFDVDCLLSDGKMVFAGLTRDWPQPYCKEVGAEIPPHFSVQRLKEIEAFAARTLLALGFQNGVFHVEVMYTPAGPRLIEVNARMGGGPRRDMNRLVWGVDLAEQYILTALGLSISPQPAGEPLMHIAQSFLPAPWSGRMRHTDFLASIRNDERVIECATYVKPGQSVCGGEGGPADWLGNIMVRGDSPEKAIAALHEIVARIDFPIVPAQRA